MIPGIPGAPEPVFRTRALGVVSLDALIEEVCHRLAEDGLTVSPRVAKAAVQCARARITDDDHVSVEELALHVSAELRHLRMLFVPDMVEEVLLTYVRLVFELDISEVLTDR